MKQIFFIVSFLMSSILSPSIAQNLQHVATNTNGSLGNCLFPQDENGNVVYSGDVEVCTAQADVMDMIMEFWAMKKLDYNLNLEQKVKTSKTVAYRVECPLGKQYFGIEVFGSPVFSRYRDASNISFDCKIQVYDGGFKYTFNNFWTKRNMLKGESKNDGYPNIIHWQRVNSLTKERDNFLKDKDPNDRANKEILYDYDYQIKYENSLYKMEYNVVDNIIKDLIDIDNDNKKETIRIEKAEIKNLDLSNYSGNLLARGNNVYITSYGMPYEEAAVGEFIKQITIDSLWTIVGYPEQAHFIMEYHVNTEGRDKACLVVKDRTGERYIENVKSGSEAMYDNRLTAYKMYMDLFRLVQKMEKGKKVKELQIFQIK